MLSASIFSGLSLSARSACAAGAKAASGKATQVAAIPNCTMRAARRENAARAARRRPDSGRRNGLFMQSHLNGIKRNSSELPGLFGRGAEGVGGSDLAAHLSIELHYPDRVVVVHAVARHHRR